MFYTIKTESLSGNDNIFLTEELSAFFVLIRILSKSQLGKSVVNIQPKSFLFGIIIQFLIEIIRRNLL